MPMTAKFVFQANSSLLKSRHVLLINEYLNPGYFTDISHSTCIHLNASSFPYNPPRSAALVAFSVSVAVTLSSSAPGC